MNGFARAARFVCGAICWSSACTLMAATWTVDYQFSGLDFETTQEVDGYGEAATANTAFEFLITEHGTIGTGSPEVIKSYDGTSEGEGEFFWSGQISPPLDTG